MMQYIDVSSISTSYDDPMKMHTVLFQVDQPHVDVRNTQNNETRDLTASFWSERAPHAGPRMIGSSVEFPSYTVSASSMHLFDNSTSNATSL